MKLTGGQAAVKALEIENTSHVFGLIGSATMELFDALYSSETITFIGVRDERTGTHMADGFARASGKPGVILAGQNGPGATNLVTGLAQAKAAFSPVISLAGALSTEHLYRDAFQEVDQEALFKSITKKSWTVPSAERVPELMREAFRTALAPRRGPVHLNLPRNVLSATAEISEMQHPEQYRPLTPAAASDDTVKTTAKKLVTAKQPIILVGGAIKNTEAYEIVLDLAEQLHCPIVSAPGHGDAIPFSHPLNAGQMGPRGNIVASRLAKEADVILALGTRLGFNSTFYSYDNINAKADIIQVEHEPTAIGRHFPVSLGILADAPVFAQQLGQTISAMQKRSQADAWCTTFQAERSAYLEKRDADAIDYAFNKDLQRDFIQPSGLFKALRSALPTDAAITMDAGTLCLQATDNLNYHQPKSLFTPLDFGLVGFSFACGLGVKLAMPERPVISFMGDGGFGMTVSELSTAVDYGINTVTIVMNNGSWGAEKAYQRDFFGGRYIGADITSPPFDKLAELYGAKGYAVDRLDTLPDVLNAALSCGKPAVIDISVDPAALYSFRRDSFTHRAKE